VGYDFTGRASGKNDLPDLIRDYRRYVETGSVESPLSKVVTRSELGTTWLAQPHLSASDVLDDGDQWVLDDLCAAVKNGRTAPRNAYTASGLHMVKVGNLTGRGIEWESVERQFVEPHFAERNPLSVLHKAIFYSPQPRMDRSGSA
jgi:type I restriction enzyme M protein